MTTEIKNCGLIALKNISELKDISIRTMLNIAEDNGLYLYAYKIPVDEVCDLLFPAIVHSVNHFSYITKKEELEGLDLTGYVITTSGIGIDQLNRSELHKILGSSWIAVGAAAVQATTAVVKGVNAHKQKKKAEKMEKSLVAPQMEKTESELRQLQIAKNAANNNRLPGQSAAEDAIGANSATAIRNVQEGGTDPAGIMLAAAAVNQNQNDANVKLATKAAEMQNSNRLNYENALSQMANKEDRMWENNKNSPYLRKAAAIRALKGAAKQNMDKAANEFSGAVVAGAGAYAGGTGATNAKIKKDTTKADPNAGSTDMYSQEYIDLYSRTA